MKLEHVVICETCYPWPVDTDKWCDRCHGYGWLRAGRSRRITLALYRRRVTSRYGALQRTVGDVDSWHGDD